MLQERARTIARQHHFHVSVFFAATVASAFETALLQRKYDLFTCGFLQPYCFPTFVERLAFIAGLLFYNVVVTYLAALAAFIIVSRFRTWRLETSVAFMLIYLTGVLGWLNVKFAVLAYFNDVVNLEIAREIAGGSLKSAISYLANEIIVYGLFFLVFVTFVILAYRGILQLTTPLKSGSLSQDRAPGRPATYGAVFLLIVLLTGAINLSPKWSFEFRRTFGFAIVSRILDKASDFDFDGRGIFRHPPDQKPFDRKIFPGAVDIPANGIDEDQIAGDFIDDIQEQDRLASIKPRAGKHILLVVLESVRYDVLKQKVNGEYVAPNLRDLAQMGTSVRFAYSQTGFTVSSIKAIWNRSLNQTQHMIRLADFLTEAGYEISVFSGQDESFGGMSEATGLQEKAKYFFDSRSAPNKRIFSSRAPGSLTLRNETVLEQIRRKFASLDWCRPQFIYVNLQAAHFPYYYDDLPIYFDIKPIRRREIRASRKTQLAETYWNAVAHDDWAIGQILQVIEQMGLTGQVVIAVTSDHGESLFDDQFLGHGHALNDEQTRIPLVFNQPDVDIQEPVGQTELGEILVKLALGRQVHRDNQDKFVFQIVGPLDHAGLIGGVFFSGNRIVLNPNTRMVHFSDTGKWRTYASLEANSRLKAQVDRIVRYWEHLRWQKLISHKRNRALSLSNSH